MGKRLLQMMWIVLYISKTVGQLPERRQTADNNCGRMHKDGTTDSYVCSCRYVPHDNVSGMYIDCSNRNLTAVPKQLPSDAKYLNLSHNAISGKYLVNDPPFWQFPNLLKVFLCYNNISHIEERTFLNLTNLTHLDITRNYIRYDNNSIFPTAFMHVQNIRSLRMKQSFHNFTEEETYPDKALSVLKQLDTLHIDAMPNTPLGKGFQNLTKLKHLVLSSDCCPDQRCNVPQIDTNMLINTPYIHYIRISKCNVHKIMYNAFASLPELTILNLNWNDNLTFNCLHNLTSGLLYTKIDALWLIGIHDYYSGCNRLTVEHLQFLHQTNITKLYIGSNRISELTLNATDYLPPSLRFISIPDNMLLYGEYVKKIFNNNLLPNLKELRISNQFESKLPGNLPPYHNVGDKRSKHVSDEWMTNDNNLETIAQHGLHSRKQKHSVTLIPSDKILGYSPHHDRLGIQRSTRSTLTLEENINNGCPNTTACLRLPESLNILVMTNMRIRMPLGAYNLTTQPNSLKRLYMNRNMFLKWYGPITGFNALNILDLSENGCDLVEENFFFDMPELQLLNLSYNYLGDSLHKDYNGRIFSHLTNLQTIDLNNNKILALPQTIFSGLENLQTLILSNNILLQLDIELAHMPRLTLINLTGNVLTSLPPSITNYLDKGTRSRNITVSLQDNNNIRCDCLRQTFLQWMLKTKVKFDEMSTYTCINLKHQRQKLTRHELKSNILPILTKQCYDYTWIYIFASVVSTFVIGALGGSLAYRKRYYLYYLYYKVKFGLLGTNTREGYEQLDMKDIDISYANTEADTHFIRHELQKELEDNGGFTLHIEDRDGELGVYKSEAIVRGIIESRRTLIILTRDFVRQNYCRFILNMVRETAIQRNAKIMYFMRKGISADTLQQACCDGKLHLEVLKMMDDTTYADVIEYPPNVNDLPAFWETLRARLRGADT